MESTTGNDAPANRGPQVAHPWHGVDPFVEDSGLVQAFIDIVPGDAMKYELDKPAGWLRIDRPQQFSGCSCRCACSC
jgi:inorganic pyrophosphatase